jgi:hypothetical protein
MVRFTTIARYGRTIGDADWRGTSDTETLLAGLRALGAPIARSLKGMFAFVIYDHASRSFSWRATALASSRSTTRWMQKYPSRLRGKGSRWPGSTITSASIGAYLQWGACPEDQLLYSAFMSFRRPRHDHWSW